MISVKIGDVIAFTILVITVCLIFLSCTPEEIDEYMDENYNTIIMCNDADNMEVIESVFVTSYCGSVTRVTNDEGQVTFYFRSDIHLLLCEHENYFDRFSQVEIEEDSTTIVSVFMEKKPEPFSIGENGDSLILDSGAILIVPAGALQNETSILFKSLNPSNENPNHISKTMDIENDDATPSCIFMIKPLSLLFTENIDIIVPFSSLLEPNVGDTLYFSIYEEGNISPGYDEVFGIVNEDLSSITISTNSYSAVGKNSPANRFYADLDDAAIVECEVSYIAEPHGPAVQGSPVIVSEKNYGVVDFPNDSYVMAVRAIPYDIFDQARVPLEQDYYSIVYNAIPTKAMTGQAEVPVEAPCAPDDQCWGFLWVFIRHCPVTQDFFIYEIRPGLPRRHVETIAATYPFVTMTITIERMCHQGSGGDQ